MLRVGVLGAGGIGNRHAQQYLKMSDVELSVYDPDSAKQQAFCEKYGAAPCQSAEDLIGKVEAVDICLPNDLHLEFGLKSVAARKPTFMEKPITRSLDEARQLVSAADAAGVPFMVGQVVRYFPEFKTGNRLVKNGSVGTPAAARMRRGGAAPTAPWFLDHTRSGGVLIDLAVHDFDWLRWTLGEVDHLYSRSLGAQTMQGPDYALTTLTFDSGAVAHVETTWMDPSGFRTSFEVCGSGGMIEFDSRKAAALTTHASDGSRFEGPLSPMDDPYLAELKDFVLAVKDKTPVPVTAYDGFMALSIALAASESARTGNVVKPERTV